MRGVILIAVKALEDIEEIVPKLTTTVKAGTRVVFLVRCPVSFFQLCCLNYVDLLRPGASTALAERYSPSMEAQAQLHEPGVSAACDALSRQGVHVTVDFYTGSLRRPIKKYTARENVQLVITATGAGPRFLGRILSLFGFSKHRHIPPALLFRRMQRLSDGERM